MSERFFSSLPGLITGEDNLLIETRDDRILDMGFLAEGWSDSKVTLFCFSV
jgi:hypothetical protein